MPFTQRRLPALLVFSATTGRILSVDPYFLQVSFYCTMFYQNTCYSMKTTELSSLVLCFDDPLIKIFPLISLFVLFLCLLCFFQTKFQPVFVLRVQTLQRQLPLQLLLLCFMNVRIPTIRQLFCNLLDFLFIEQIPKPVQL